MNIKESLRLFVLGLGTVALCVCYPASSWGQKPPPPANPQAPTINPVIPTGVQRGQAADFVLTGTNLASPTGVSIGCAAKVTIPSEEKNGTDPTKCKVRIETPADTPIGWYTFRFATIKGVSNLRVFCVDDLPQVVADGKNRSASTAQALPAPCTISGAVAAEQGDYYKITVKAGQRMSFDCQARRIGSAIDAYLKIYDGKGIRELAYDNDSPGCQTDPRITYTFKQAGDYIIEVRDVLLRGGPEFFYRVRIGDFPLASTPMPLAAKRGTKAKLGFTGPAVEGIAALDVDVPADASQIVHWVAPKGASGLHGGPVQLLLSDLDENAEQEPNDDPKKAQRITVPCGISGRFHQGNDVDCFVFAAKKGQKLTIEAQTLELFSPSLVQMYVKNSKGAEVAKSNPSAPPPGDQKIDFTAAEDGDFVLEVQHLYFFGGHSETYRVTLRTPTVGFDVNLPNERFDVSPSGAAAVPVQIVRKGYTGPIELSAQGQSGLSGTATLKTGQNAGILLVIAKGDLPMGAYQFQVVAKATIDGKTVVQSASAGAIASQSLNGLKYLPLHLPRALALAVKEKAPFSLAIKMDPPEAVPGSKAMVTVTATRDPGFVDEITLNPPTGLPPTVPVPKFGAIAKDKTEISFPLDVNAKTPIGEYFVLLSAKTKHQGKEYAAAAPPLLLTVGAPFDLKVDPTAFDLKQGEKKTLRVTAIRKAGYTGPISLEVRKLPATVTATKAVIAANQTTADIEIAVAPTAPEAEITGVDVAGIATGMNNLANASPAITVRVKKK